jgi:hypothetical protein
VDQAVLIKQLIAVVVAVAALVEQVLVQYLPPELMEA